MGVYLNPGTGSFRMAKRSQIFVDKSGLIATTNRVTLTLQRFMCVSRPRRFGKSMAMDMLSAYYSRGQDSHELFEGMNIRRDASFEEHINKYDVLKINMQTFLSGAGTVDEMLRNLQTRIMGDLRRSYPDLCDDSSPVYSMQDIYAQTGRPFVILIDEWDCIFREYRESKRAQEAYLDFLRMWLKDQDYVALAYMTGILPIKKYGTHSALNMFTEYSMTDPGGLAEYFGFTDADVRALCDEYHMSYNDARAWYDGYELCEESIQGTTVYSIYNPKSVVESMLHHKFGTYWNRTETYEALKVYIQMNMDGLKDSIVKMLAGTPVRINIGTFVNDMTTFATKDDVLTLLVHLGYLTYNAQDKTVSIPNKEVSMEYINAIGTMDWHEVARSIEASEQLLRDLWEMNGDAVAAGIDRAHDEIAILQYNNENALSCAIHLAFYYAREYYTIVRELPAGKGFADICFVPRPKFADKPAAIIELKWDRSVHGAIAQIREKQYVNALKDYHGSLLLAEINYDKETKRHSCVIERANI